MEVLLSHDRFFTRLVNLIPTDLYNHTESMTGKKNIHVPEVVENSVFKAVDGEEGNSKYFKHKKQPLAADEKKLLRQERKKRKYEPDQDEIEEDILPSNQTGEIDADEEKDEEVKQTVYNKSEPTANLDELRKRLQDRISQMREQRQTKKPRVEEKPKKTDKKTDSQRSVAENSSVGSESNSKTVEKSSSSSSTALSRAEALQRELLASSPAASAVSMDTSGIEFNPILQNEADISEQIRVATKKKEGGKVARLQRLLKEAENKRERLTALMSSKDETLQAKARAEQWNDVLTVAAGGKALLVSTIGHNVGKETTKAEQRIKKALKKREKKKEKSAKEWNERLRNVEDEKNARLDKRDENIKMKKQRHLGKASKEDADGKKGGESSGRRGDYKGKTASTSSSSSTKASFGHRAGFEGKKSSGKFLNK